MILEEIRLTDFRCFYGESSIVFSTDPDKNVTLIYAENGLGKTTILNALLWCFYGDTTSRFEKKEDILNYDAKKEGKTLASVEVLFEHAGNRYIAKRYFRSPGNSDGGRSFVVARFDRGSQTAIEPPDTFINTVIPREMASHFLFDGEHAEVFLGENNRSSIRAAVRDILGCSLVESAIDDLQAISAQFRKQIPTTPATQRIASLSAQIDLLSTQIETATQEVQRLESHHTLVGTQIRDIEERLRNTTAAKELQSGRDKLNEQMRRTEKRQRDYRDEVYRWLGENGNFIVSKRITEETFDFLDEKQHRGRIPSPYNEEFVKDILASETCICGAHLEPGGAGARQVSSLLERAANQVMRDRVAKVRARLSNLRSERLKAPAKLIKAKERLAEANEEFASIEAQLGEIHDRLKGINFEDIAAKEQRLDELKRELSNIDRTVGALKGRIETSERDKSAMDREINVLAQQNGQTAIYARRRNLCETVKGTLETLLVDEERQALKVLQSRIARILENTTRKALRLRMTSDYAISLVNADGTALPKSSGENQLLGLAFTAALVEFAKLREKARDYKLLAGTIAPLVLDSPFGQLDESYRATTAEFIPKMARQVVLLVSKSQGSSDVLAALRANIGSEFILVRHNKDGAGEKRAESRELNGREFRTAVFDSAFDGTEIVAVA